MIKTTTRPWQFDLFWGRKFQVAQASQAGVIPEDKIGNFGGSWSALSDAGEATNPNLVHKKGGGYREDLRKDEER